MTIFKPNTELLKKLANSFASFHYDADVEVVQKARYPKGGDELTAFLSAMAKANVEPLAKGTPNPYGVIHKTSDYVVSVGANLSYVRKNEAIMKRGGVTGTYTPDHSDRGMFPVYGELLYVKNDLSTMYFTVYQASVAKTVWTADGKSVLKENVVQLIKDTKPFNSMCGTKNKSEICDVDGNLIYQQNEDGTIRLDKDGNPMTMETAQIRRVKLENADVRIKGNKIKFVTDEPWDLAELARIRDAYYAQFDTAE